MANNGKGWNTVDHERAEESHFYNPMPGSLIYNIRTGTPEWFRFRAWMREIDVDLRSMERWADDGFQSKFTEDDFEAERADELAA